MSVFPNAKPKLLGDPEDSIGIIDTPAVAGLSGDVSNDMNVQFIEPSLPEIDTTNVSTTETILQTITLDYTKDKNVGFILFVQDVDIPSSTNGTLRIRRGGLGGNIVNSVGINFSNTKVILEGTENNRPIGLQSYVLTCIRNSGDFQIIVSDYSAVNGFGAVSNIDDLHAGTISTPATATKQINSPDSHTTHETEVLP